MSVNCLTIINFAEQKKKLKKYQKLTWEKQKTDQSISVCIGY